jgi:hypothetical protein
MSETVRTSEVPTQLNSGCGQGQKLECSPGRLRRQGERIFFPDADDCGWTHQGPTSQQMELFPGAIGYGGKLETKERISPRELDMEDLLDGIGTLEIGNQSSLQHVPS